MPVPTRTVTAENLHTFCSQILQAVRVCKPDADTTATIQVEADLRGVHSHGTRAISRYTRQILNGKVNPEANPHILKEGGAYVHIDGDNGLGQAVSHFAAEKAIEKARTSGIGMAAVRNSTHFGAAAYYAQMATEQNLVGFSTTGGRKLSGNMAAFGSIEPVISNHPLAFAVPAGNEPPIVLDMATGVAAAGKISMAQTRGEKIPLDWALTQDGQPTDDPKEARIVQPLGPKGSGLSIIMNCIGGILTGAGFSDTAPFGHLIIAIDVATFADLDTFKQEIDTRIESIRNAKPAPGIDRVYYPGEQEALLKTERLEQGIPMLEPHLQDLEAIAAELSVTPPWEST